jgi:hypothetical protein
MQFIILSYIYSKKPILTPVTDDWLYLGLGTHETPLFRVDSFELINGHQQVLVKTLVWLIGYLPGLYFSHIWNLNALLALTGIYLVISSQLFLLSRKVSYLQVLILVIILCNFKPLYLYMSFTGTGLCLTLFFYGIYCYADARLMNRNSQIVKVVCAFLAPFATGFGVSLAIAYIIETIAARRFNISTTSHWKTTMKVFIAFIGIVISSILPVFLNLENSRSPGNGNFKLGNLFDFFENPLKVVYFIFGLLGSALTPSSRFDPWLPLLVGAVLSCILLWNLACIFTLKNFIRAVLLNKNPILGGLVFLLLLLIFRGLGSESSLDESTAPRYVMGTSLLLIGFVFLILASKHRPKRVQVPFALLLVFMTLSLSGLKSGLEWLSVRNIQTETVRACLHSEKLEISPCLNAFKAIEEGESSNQDNATDLRSLTEYLKKKGEVHFSKQ